LKGRFPDYSVSYLKRFFVRSIINKDRSSLQQGLFHVHIRRQSIVFFKVLLGFLILLVAGLWPTDPIIFQEPAVIEAFFAWRTVVLSCIALFFLAVNFQFFRRRIFVLVYSGFLLVIGTTAYLFGGVETITASTPWFYIIFTLPFGSVIFSVRIVRRTLSTVLIPVVYFLAFFQLDWIRITRELVFTGVYLNLMVAMIVLSILLGQMIYNLNRSNFFQSRERKKQRRRIRTLANHDQLTGLYNRRKIEERIREEFKRSLRYDLRLTIMIIDLDHFKHVNDTFGHQTGDQVLEEVGEIIQSTTRRSDLAARYGGEEFCVVLPETGIDQSLDRAERLREQLKERTFQSNGEEFSVTCSIGVARLEDEEEYSELMERADDLLYEAKHEGRDCVICQ